MLTKTNTYLGGKLYAEFDGYDFVLSVECREVDAVSFQLAINPKIFKNLVEYSQSILKNLED